MDKLKSPFPYFGSKNKVSTIIWNGLGNISNYVEPFAGSLAVLLSNPNIPKIETVNDKYHHISNVWRSLSNDPDGVAKFADYPVSEVDLHARQKWIIDSKIDFNYKMENDPDFYDIKIAGWWVYGQCASIGDNWLSSKGLKSAPLLSCAGCGINGLKYSIQDNFKKLQQRLRRVRICCGDWKRVITPAVTYKNKGLCGKDITGIFLDPPYDLSNRDKVYVEDNNIYREVCAWAIDNGDNNKLRIVVCGYDGDYEFPNNWTKYNWKSNGLGNMGNDRGKDNLSREIIYFSPYCLQF